MAESFDEAQTRVFADGLFAGRLFAFIDLKRPSLQWLQPLLCQTRRVFSLLSSQTTDLAGLRFPSQNWPELDFRGVQAAKDLHLIDETIHLLSYGLSHVSSEQELVLHWNGQEYARYPVLLNEHGLALTGLRALPLGEFTAFLQGQSGPPTRFLVAQYQLSPLSASLLGQTYDSEKATLRLTLYLERFGQPVSGVVEMADADSGRPLPAAAALAGMLALEISLEEEAPSALTLWLSQWPEANATLALHSTQPQQRNPLVISRLGPEVTVSTLPEDGSRPIRGLYLKERGLWEAPFRLERVDSSRAILTCLRAVENLTVVLLDPAATQPYRETQVAACAAQQKLELDVSGPAAVLALGAFVEGRPWEGWTALLRPVALKPVVKMPAQVKPGSQLTFSVECPGSKGCLYVTLMDVRQSQSATLGSRLAEAMKLYLEKASQQLLGSDQAPQRISPPAPPAVDPFAASEPFAAPSTSDPFATAADPFGAPPASDPFATAADPFGAPPASDPFATAADPFGALPASDPFATAADPFGAPLASDPFATAADPFGAPSASDPFATAADPFGAPPASDPFSTSADPFAAPSASDPFATAADPFGAPPASDPFGTAADPFGAPPASDPFATAADPFAVQSASDPFATAADPFAVQSASDPFATAADPFAVQSASDPFATAADPFGAPPASDPFATAADPFAVQSASDPFATAADPFGAPSISDPFLTTADPFAALSEPLEMPTTLPNKKPPLHRVGYQKVETDPLTQTPPRRRRSDQANSPQSPSDLLFCALLPLEKGAASATLSVPARPSEYRLSGMLVEGWDWAPVEARVSSFSDPLLWLEGPSQMSPGDDCEARLIARARSGHLELGASAQGQPQVLYRDGLALANNQLVDFGAVQVQFAAQPGEIQAWAQDRVTGQRSFQSELVRPLGCVSRLAYSIRLLLAGQSLEWDDSARVVDDLGQTCRRLVLGWLADLHGNCLAEAVGVVAATCLLRVDPAEGEGYLREKLDRIRRLWLPGSGFRAHEGQSASRDLALPAARLLRSLGWVQTDQPGLQQALQQGLTIAQDVEFAGGRNWPPGPPTNCQDAYFSLRTSSAPGVSGWMEDWLSQTTPDCGRTEVAYAAACCLRLGWNQALPLCQQILHTLDPEPISSHPLELAATSALLVELLAYPELSAGEAESNPNTGFHATKGMVAVEGRVWIEEDWLKGTDSLGLSLTLESGLGPLRVGQNLHLLVHLDEPMEPGDSLWVFLPDCLCRLEGGGQLRRFSLECPADGRLRLPLLALRATRSQQVWVGLRNFLQPSRRATVSLVAQVLH